MCMVLFGMNTEKLGIDPGNEATCSSYLSCLSLLRVTGVGIQRAQYLHGLIVLRLSSQYFLKTLCCVLNVATGNVHLTKAKVR